MYLQFQILVVLTISLLTCSIGCNQKADREPESKILGGDHDVHIYMSTDSAQVFQVQIIDGAMQIRSEHNGEEFTLSKVPSASGVKYQNDEKYFFWNNGIDFMWGKGQITLAQGQLVSGSTFRKAQDPKQTIKTSYSKKLVWNNLTFLVQVKDTRLSIKPSGLEIDNHEKTHEIDGGVSLVEIGDLNNDNYPEVMVYITSDGSGSYGSIIGYSVNNGKSLSQIYLPDLSGIPEISKGYMGHDEFAIVENSFVQRFPIYNPNDTNAEPSGGTRQVQYKLIDGEGSRLLMVDKVVEY